MLRVALRLLRRAVLRTRSRTMLRAFAPVGLALA